MPIPDFQSLMLPLLNAVADGGDHTNRESTASFSTFSKDAHDYVSRIERKIVLIDGKALAQLMIDHDIGVTTRSTYVVKQMDGDFFLEEDVWRWATAVRAQR
jgi:restriction system protein